MATQSGNVQNFKNVTLSIRGYPVDAYDDAGIAVAWQGPEFTVKVGPGGVAMYVATGNRYAIVTVTLLPASNSIAHIHAWLESGVPRPMSLLDANSTTFLVEARAMPEQRPALTYNATANPMAINIHCPSFGGPIGGLKNV